MKYILKFSYLITCISLLVGLGSCVKDRNDLATDFSNLQPLVEIRDNISGIGNDAGLANFGKASLNFSGDPHTQSFYVNLASVYPMNKDLTLTLGVDQAALDAYNADPANTVKYELFPDSLYSFTQTSVTIKAGERVALVSVEFFPTNIDPSKSYMLPISITDAEGVNISGNFGTIYYHVIGNPLAGIWVDQAGSNRTLFATTIADGTIVGIADLEGLAKVMSPDDATHARIDFADLGTSGWQYVITYDQATGSFAVDANETMAASITAGSFKLLEPPTYDPATETIHIKSQYTNSVGSERLIEETLVLQ